MPFLSVTAHQTGTYRLCCEDELIKEEEVLWNVKNTTIEEMRNSIKMKEFRLKMLRWEELKECKICNLKKIRGVRSKRDINNDILFKKDLESIFDTTDFNSWFTSQEVKYIDVRFSNICNLACRMCWSGSSSSRIELDKLTRNYAQPIVQDIWKLEDFKKVLQTVEMIYIAWWEPFLDKNFDIFLEHITSLWIAKNIVLKINTNLTIITEEHIKLLTKFKKVQMVVSCDGYGEVYEYIRIGAKWSKFLKNLITLKRALPLFWKWSWIDINTVVQIDNAFNLPKLHHFCHKVWVKNNLSILQVPEYMYLWVMPDRDKFKILTYYKKFIELHKSEIPNLEKKLSEIMNILKSWWENLELYDKYLEEKRKTDKYVYEKKL